MVVFNLVVMVVFNRVLSSKAFTLFVMDWMMGKSGLAYNERAPLCKGKVSSRRMVRPTVRFAKAVLPGSGQSALTDVSYSSFMQCITGGPKVYSFPPTQ
jgi:hypothetical protein